MGVHLSGAALYSFLIIYSTFFITPMLSLNDLKTGIAINLDGTPFEVVKYQHVKMGRGGAMMRTTLKNLLTGNSVEKTFKGDEKFVPADISPIRAQFLYRQGENFVFMDSSTFDQFELDAKLVGFAQNFLKDGQEVELITFNGNPINIRLLTKMTFKVTEAEPAVKGDTATNPQKNVTIETGYSLRAPMFIKEGENIVVDTRDGSYIERSKS